MSVKDLILKVAALAQNGVGGEKTNAEALLTRLLKANNMTLADLESAKNPKRERMFFVGEPNFEQLLVQIVCKVLDVNEFTSFYYKAIKKVGVQLTDGEFIRVSMLFDIYSAAFKRERQKLLKQQRLERNILFSAFVHKHELCSNKPNPHAKTNENEILEILKMARELEDVHVREELPGRMLEVKK